MYKVAQHCHAYQSLEGPDRTIFYEEGSSDLSVCLIFATRRDAEDFQNELTDFAFLHSHFKDKLRLKREVAIVEPIVDLIRVMYVDYHSEDNDESPAFSLNDMIASPQTSVITVGQNLNCNLQALENEYFARAFGSKWYRCHLISAKHEKYKKDADNCIYASWLFHQQFDGLNTEMGQIGVLIEFNSLGDVEEVMVEPGRFEPRQRVNVSVIFRNRDVATVFGNYLKEGTQKIDDCTFTSFLHARNGENMRYFLEEKVKLSDWRLETMSNISDEG
jgi:hypothetical protein